MYIKEFIKILDVLPSYFEIQEVDIENSGSDRGDYCNFCLCEGDKKVLVGELSDYIKTKVIGYEFEGYKGGEFLMSENTEIKYGYPDCGGYDIDGILIDEYGAKIKKWRRYNF